MAYRDYRDPYQGPSRLKVFLWILLALAVIAGLSVGGWYLHWHLAKSSVDRTYQINTHSQQYQQSLIQQERDYAHDYDAVTNDGQKEQLKSTFCSTYADLTQPPNDLIVAYSRICNNS
jgi:hypothetical protein